MSHAIPNLSARDHIESHAHKAWALSELLVDHFCSQEDRNVLSDDVMVGLMENISGHLEEIRKLARVCTEKQGA
ncbi:hypothetical protein [Halomonas sp. H5]|uniref:hypothetical protein n=1 Tax=Halomonas sp. H5 TaxID=3423910 RepID=UPI003D364128